MLSELVLVHEVLTLLLNLIVNKLNIDVDVRAMTEGEHVLETVLMNCCLLWVGARV